MSFYIILDPPAVAGHLSWSAVAEQQLPAWSYDETASSPFGEDNGLLDDITKITEPYSALFAELEGFDPVEPLQTELFPQEFDDSIVLTPPATPPAEIDSSDELLSITNELLSGSPMEIDFLFKSVEAEVRSSSEYDAFSPSETCASPTSTYYGLMSPGQVYGSDTTMSDGSFESGSSLVTIGEDYLSLFSDPYAEDHSYSRSTKEQKVSAPVTNKRKTQRESKNKSPATKPTRSRFSAEDRRLRKKEQNKQAAIRYRQKKKEEQQTFAMHEKELVQTHRSLSREANKVRAEIRIVKNIMREHFKAKGLL